MAVRGSVSAASLMKLVGAFQPASLGPGPSAADVTVSVSCANSRTRPSGRHDVVIHSDWSVATPHDLASERVAAALGGYLSCLDLMDHVVPAARMWVDLAARRVLPEAVRIGAGSTWQPKKRVVGCCAGESFRDAGVLGAHLRSADHLAARLGCDPRQLAVVVRACRLAHAGGAELALGQASAAAAARCCLGGLGDVEELWRAGVHPEFIQAVHRSLEMSGRLPGRFYLGVVTRRPDLRWVARTLAAADDDQDADELRQGAVATWLAWTASPRDRAEPDERGDWLRIAVSQPMIEALAESVYRPQDVTQLALALRREPDGVARILEAWLRAGCTPSVNDLLGLEEAGVPTIHAVSGPALKRLRAEVEVEAAFHDDTELGLLLVAAGTVPQAVAVLKSGWAKRRAAAAL